MNTFCNTLNRGWPLALELDEVLLPDEVFAAHDDFSRYLVVHDTSSSWLCAPISELALRCVASGRAELRSAFAHSLTGMVERFTVEGGAVCGESMIPCAELRDEDLPRPGARLGWEARCA